MANDVRPAGEPTMGNSIEDIENVSGVPVVGSTVVRHSERGPGGRFKARAARLVGPLGPPGGVGSGGIDAVTGRPLPGVRNQAQLHDLERIHAVTATPNFSAPDWSSRVHPDRKSNAHIPVMEDMINHSMDCAGCATGGIPSIFSTEEIG